MNRKLQEELAAMSREMITLQNQVSDYQDQIENLKLQSQQYIGEVKKAEDLLQNKTDDKISDLLRQNQLLATKLSDAASKLSNAEKLLNEARQEGVEMKLKNEDTVGEIQYLKEKITELEQRLVHCLCKVCSTKCSTGFEMCEKKCLEIKNRDDAARTSQKTNGEARQASSLTLSVEAIEPLVSRLIDKPLFFNAKTNKLQTDSLITNCSKDAIAYETQIMATSVSSSEISSYSDFSNGQYQPKYTFKETTHETLKANPISSIPPTIKENDIWNYQPKEVTPNSNEAVNSKSKLLKRNVRGSVCKEMKCYPNCTLYNPRDKICNKFNITNKIFKEIHLLINHESNN
ncbi:hypothetical protein WA026_020811 [Henosepilachna vigintioctopunctata]|uniref:Uncharacterized protein n=1 Tax=Henosepilachna vigintioctopunctata TaxID=420089 RepID=A0AAW1TYW9_9CUCU